MNWELIDRLLLGSCYSEEKREVIHGRFEELEEKEGEEFTDWEIESILEDLRNNQLDPIAFGGYYNQTDIKYHLKKFR